MTINKKATGNDGSGNIPERDTWETPQELWCKLDRQYEFGFDCCASENNTKCLFFSNDFLNRTDMFADKNNEFMSWMNPPFSKANVMFKHFFIIVNMGIAIYRCDNLETKIWQEVILPNCDWVFIPKGRISYEGKEGKGSRFPSALIGVGLPPPIDLDGHTLFICDFKRKQ